MRDDARARLEREQGRTQKHVYFLQQVHGDHGGRRQVGLKKVLLPKLNFVGHAGTARIHFAPRHQRGVNVHTQPGSFKTFGRENHNTSIA